MVRQSAYSATTPHIPTHHPFERALCQEAESLEPAARHLAARDRASGVRLEGLFLRDPSGTPPRRTHGAPQGSTDSSARKREERSESGSGHKDRVLVGFGPQLLVVYGSVEGRKAKKGEWLQHRGSVYHGTHMEHPTLSSSWNSYGTSDSIQLS